MEKIVLLIVVVVILIFVIAFVHANSVSEGKRREINERFLSSLGVKNGRDRVLLMFAHPDDETMFFTPTLLALNEGGAKIHFLCLSNGDNKNLGWKRITEMYEVAGSLGIPRDCVKIAHFDDRPGLKWSSSEVAQTLDKCVREWKIDSVITFDDRGVSGHANHVSCYEAARLYAETNQKVDLYALLSEGKRTRYLGTLALPRGGDSRIAVSNSARKALSLMRHHESQNTWWRKLHIALSSHTYVNRLIKL